jgi:D-alanine-D-alanine ligase-like ATP-grasp enzyme
LNLTILRDAPHLHPLAWIHRSEARALAGELRGAGRAVRLARFKSDLLPDPASGPLLLRLSDPAMLAAAQALARAGRPYLGPSPAVMERCYDKYQAYRLASAHGVDCPVTYLAGRAGAAPFPLVLKPRRGSDSIGVRILRRAPLPARFRTDGYLAQQYVRGAELTIGVFRARVGMPLRIILPEGAPYSFLRKYLWRPPRAPLADAELAERVRGAALRIAGIFAVDWAARIDMIHESETGRLCFLECDVAPLVGARSAFAASFAAAGISRAEQWRMLLNESASGAGF